MSKSVIQSQVRARMRESERAHRQFKNLGGYQFGVQFGQAAFEHHLNLSVLEDRCRHAQLKAERERQAKATQSETDSLVEAAAELGIDLSGKRS